MNNDSSLEIGIECYCRKYELKCLAQIFYILLKWGRFDNVSLHMCLASCGNMYLTSPITGFTLWMTNIAGKIELQSKVMVKLW